MALAAMQDETQIAISEYTPQEMAVRLADMKQKVDLLQTFFKEIMEEGQDYGVIPGTQKPTLLKPGAEKLCEFYGYSIGIEVDEQSNVETGYYRARVKAILTSRRTGRVIAEGVGEANTMEGRYHWRWVPEDEVPPTLDKAMLKSKPGDKWVFASEIPQDMDRSKLPKEERVSRRTGKPYTVFNVGTTLYRIPNDDPWTLWNTVLKMGKKRALVDVVLSATRSSGLFTQDVEDLQDWIGAGAVIDVPFTSEEESGQGEGDKSKDKGKPAGNARTKTQAKGSAAKPKGTANEPPPKGNGNGDDAMAAAKNLFWGVLGRFMDRDLGDPDDRKDPDVVETAKAMWIAATNKESMKGATAEDWEKAIAYVSAQLEEDDEEEDAEEDE